LTWCKPRSDSLQTAVYMLNAFSNLVDTAFEKTDVTGQWCIYFMPCMQVTRLLGKTERVTLRWNVCKNFRNGAPYTLHQSGKVAITDLHLASSWFESRSYASPTPLHFSRIKKCSLNSSCVTVTDWKCSPFWWSIFVVLMHVEHFAPNLRTFHWPSTIQVCVSALILMCVGKSKWWWFGCLVMA
jgi:hypothetical protein